MSTPQSVLNLGSPVNHKEQFAGCLPIGQSTAYLHCARLGRSKTLAEPESYSPRGTVSCLSRHNASTWLQEVGM